AAGPPTATYRSRPLASGCWCPTTRRWTGSWPGSASPSSASRRCSTPSAWATAMIADSAFLALLQLADGLFPAGGFAHSFGLETYGPEGRVGDAAGREPFLVPRLG